jgi:hypothetical protein
MAPTNGELGNGRRHDSHVPIQVLGHWQNSAATAVVFSLPFPIFLSRVDLRMQ